MPLTNALTSEFTQQKPKKIAVLCVEDDRQTQDDNRKTTERLVSGVEGALSQRIPRMGTSSSAGGVYKRGIIAPHYPIMTLSESRQKMRAAGLSENDVMHPDRKRACPILGTDAVFEAVLEDYSHGMEYVPRLAIANKASLEFWLVDCRTGELLWRNAPRRAI